MLIKTKSDTLHHCEQLLTLQECRGHEQLPGEEKTCLGIQTGAWGYLGVRSISPCAWEWMLGVSLGHSNPEMDFKRQRLSQSRWAKSWSSGRNFTLEMENG